MTFARWNNKPRTNRSAVEELLQLQDEVNRLFTAPWNGVAQHQAFNTWAPALDLTEDKEGFTVQVELPGMKKEDIDISLHDGALTISGERKTDEKHQNAQSYRSERFFGRFQRSVVLPSKVQANGVKAAYKDGTLTVNLPKAEEAKPKQIEVQIQ